MGTAFVLTTITVPAVAAFTSTGMPVTPNGGNINFAVHASGFFAL